MSLSRAKAYVPDMDPFEMTSGFPEFNTDGSEFSAAQAKAYVPGV